MTAEPRSRVLPQAVLDAMPGAVAQLSATGEILAVNGTWRALHAGSGDNPGTKVTVGANFLEHCRPDVGALIASLAPSNPGTGAVQYDITDGAQTRSFEVRVVRIEGDGYAGALVAEMDVSERRRTRDVAHDLNNLLTVVTGFAELMITAPDLPPALEPPVREILLASKRAAEITDGLISASRQGSGGSPSAAPPSDHDPRRG